MEANVPRGRRGIHPGDAVLDRLLHLLERAHVNLAHALARDAELVGEFRKCDRVLSEPAPFEDAAFAIVEHRERCSRLCVTGNKFGGLVEAREGIGFGKRNSNRPLDKL